MQDRLTEILNSVAYLRDEARDRAINQEHEKSLALWCAFYDALETLQVARDTVEEISEDLRNA